MADWLPPLGETPWGKRMTEAVEAEKKRKKEEPQQGSWPSGAGEAIRSVGKGIGEAIGRAGASVRKAASLQGGEQPSGPTAWEVNEREQEMRRVIEEQRRTIEEAQRKRAEQIKLEMAGKRKLAEMRFLQTPLGRAQFRQPLVTVPEEPGTEKPTDFWKRLSQTSPLAATQVGAMQQTGQLPPPEVPVQEFKEGEGWAVPEQPAASLGQSMQRKVERTMFPAPRPTVEGVDTLAERDDQLTEAQGSAMRDLEGYIGQKGGEPYLDSLIEEWGRLTTRVTELEASGATPEQMVEEIQGGDYMRVLQPENLEVVSGLFERYERVIDTTRQLDIERLAAGQLTLDDQLIDWAQMTGRLSDEEAKKFRGSRGVTFAQLYDTMKMLEKLGFSPYKLATATPAYWEAAKSVGLFQRYAQTRAVEEEIPALFTQNPETGEFVKPSTGPGAALWDFALEVAHDINAGAGIVIGELEDLLKKIPKLGPAVVTILNTAGHVIRAGARGLVEGLGMLNEGVKAAIGLVVSLVKYMAENDPRKKYELESELLARGRQTVDVFVEPFRNIPREFQHKPKVDIFAREPHEFEYFEDNLAKNLVANSLFDPLNFATLGTTQAGRLLAGSTVMAKLATAFPDAVAAARTVSGFAAKAQKMWQYMKPTALTSRGMWARVVKEAQDAAANGDVVPWVRATAQKFARVEDDYSFDRMFQAARIPGKGAPWQDFQDLKSAFRVIGDTVPVDDIASRSALWGRLLTDLAASGQIPRNPGRLISYWSTHPGFQKLVDSFTEMPVGRGLTRGATRMPKSGEQIDILSPAYADDIYRTAVASGFNPRAAREMARKASQLPIESTGLAQRLFFQRLTREVKGHAPTVDTKNLPDFLRRYKGMIPGYEVRPLVRAFREWDTELGLLRSEFADILQGLPKGMMKKNVFQKITGGVADAADFKKASAALLEGSQRTIKKVGGEGHIADLAEEAKRLTKAEAALAERTSKMLAGRTMDYPLVTRGLEAIRQRGGRVTDMEQEAYAIGHGGRALLGPKDMPVPPSFNQWGHYVEFNVDVLRRARATHPRDILHLSAFGPIGRAALQDFSNLANELITSVATKIWLGRPAYIIRSWSTNMVKSFMWGYVRPHRVSEYGDMMRAGGIWVASADNVRALHALDPDIIRHIDAGEDIVTSAPLKWRRQRVGKTWHPHIASDDPQQAMTNALNFFFADDIGRTYLKGGRTAAKNALAKHPHGRVMLENWGIPDFKHSDAYFDVWDEMFKAIEADAPATFDALKYHSGAADDLGRAAKYFEKRLGVAVEGEPLRLSQEDLINVMKRAQEDFIVPMSKRKIPDRQVLMRSKAGRRMEAWIGDSQTLYYTLMGTGIRSSRRVAYKSAVMDIGQQLIRQGIPPNDAMRIATNEAINVVNELLMDFSRRTMLEKEFAWIMPFADDFRLETFSYLKMFARRPHIAQNVTRLFRELKYRKEREQRPGWSVFSIPIPWPGGEEKWISIPQFMMFPELSEMTLEGEGGMGSMVGDLLTGQLGPVASWGLAAGTKGLEKLTGGAIKAWQPSYSGVTQYEKPAANALTRSAAEEAMRDAENNPGVRSGNTPFGMAVLESALLSESQKRNIGNRVYRSWHVWRNDNPEAEPSVKQMDQWVREAIQSLAPVGGSPWLSVPTALGSKFLSMPGAVYSKDEMQQMGEVEEFYKQRTKEEREAVRAKYPGLEVSTWKPEDEFGERENPYEALERRQTYEANKLRGVVRDVHDLTRDYRQAAFPGEANRWETQHPFGTVGIAALATTKEEHDRFDAKDDNIAKYMAVALRPPTKDERITRALFKPPLAAKWLGEHGYDEQGKPTEKLLLWREWERKRDAERQKGLPGLSWYDYLDYIRDQEKEHLAGQKLADRDKQLTEYAEWNKYPDDQEGLPYNEYRFEDPTRKALVDEYWQLVSEVNVLNDQKRNKFPLTADDYARIKEIQVRLDEIEQALVTLPQPNLEAVITAPGSKRSTKLTTEELQRQLLEAGRITPEELARRSRMPTPGEESFFKLKPEIREPRMSGMVKALTAEPFGWAELSEAEAMALSEKTPSELQKGEDSKGQIKVLWDESEGKYYAKSFPYNWLDPGMQDAVQAAVPAEVWALIESHRAKEGGSSGGGGYRKGGGYRRYSWKEWPQQRGFAGGTPSIVDIYFSLPRWQRKQFMTEHPELKEEFRKRKPTETDEQYTERLRLMDLADRYYSVDPSARKEFLNNHPDLVAYFEAKRQQRDNYWMKAMARAFVDNPELWERYLAKQIELTDVLIKDKARWRTPWPPRQTQVEIKRTK